MKRAMDIVFALTALMLFFPFGLIIGIILKFTGEGEIFYLQERVGKDGKIFYLIKFATMLKNSPNIGTGDITLKDDPRVLPFGKILRKTKLNEVPQILNILKGDMSVVGPRPQTPRYFSYFPQNIQKEIVRLRPGLTGVGSIIFRDEESLVASSDDDPIDFHKNVIAPYKGKLELWYKERESLWLDLKLIFLTAWVVIFPNSKLHEKLLSALPPRPF